jgi:hypothetical protein
LKAGQIAHLDGDRSNDDADNLTFLCLSHHDEYDSRTSQRKGLTVGEVRAFRRELTERLHRALALPVHFGDLIVPKDDPFAGKYIRVGEGAESAEITLTPIDDGRGGDPRYAVTGLALWGAGRRSSPHIGELEFVASLHNNEIAWAEPALVPGRDAHRISLTFSGGGDLAIDETEWSGRYGMNVTFAGIYRRA